MRSKAYPTSVIWHDLECGTYTEDLGFWRELASSHGDPVLDVGAGTGRVALELCRHGHRVTALDSDPELLAELDRRADGFELDTVVADARDFDLGRRFALCIVPMQTVQLLGGRDERISFLSCARRHLDRGGVLAIAIAEELELYEMCEGVPGPLPDICERDGVVYSSQPTAVRAEREWFVLERHREIIGARGDRIARGERDPSRPAHASRARGRGSRSRSPSGRQRVHCVDGRLRRQHGGDARCLSFVSARCTQT